MPTQVHEQPVDLDIEVAEALPTEVASDHFRSSYPLPPLRRTGRSQQIQLNSVVIENELLRIVVLPDLGGRIFGLVDKRSGADLIESAEGVALSEGGPRGVECSQGLRWSAAADRLNDLGPVDFQLVEPEADEDPGGVWLAELVPGKPLSVQVGISLPPGEAKIVCEMRTYNRGFLPVAANPRIFWNLAPDTQETIGPNGIAVRDPSTKSAMLVNIDPLTPLDARVDQGRLQVGCPVAEPIRLGPRQLNTFSFSIFPFAEIEEITAIGKGVALCVNGSTLEIHSGQPKDVKVVVQTDGGQTLETTADLSPGRPAVLNLGKPKPVAIGIVDCNREELLRWEPNASAMNSERSLLERPILAVERVFGEAIRGVFEGRDERRTLYLAAEELGLRSASLAALGIDALRRKQYEEAEALFEESLLFNGEDHLTWWLNGAAERLRRLEHRSESLLNAHFLAPLEPMLRAESFLASPASEQVLARLGDDPDAMIEVACLLFDCGLHEDLSRWAHSTLKLRELPMIRYLLAAALEESGMGVEAAAEVRKAGELPIESPYPWRDTEIRVLTLLSRRFPRDRGLEDLLSLFAGTRNKEGDGRAD